jgi:hypothetical protein
MAQILVPAIWLVSAHVIAAYAFRWERLERARVERRVWAHGLHAAIFLVVAAVFLLPWLGPKVSVYLLLLAIFRGVWDYGKAWFQQRVSAKPFTWEALAQILHLVTLGLFVWILRPEASSGWLNTWVPLYGRREVLYTLTTLAALVFSSAGGTALVRSLLDQLGKEPAARPIEAVEYRVGRMIGILERILIIGLALGGQFGAIGFVLTAKSIARFEELKDRTFAEYYLVGTLMSALVALGTAWALKGVWRLF